MKITFLSDLSPDAVRARMRSFSDSYKRDWREWIEISHSTPLDSLACAARFRDVLARWQAVRARIKGRIVRPCRSEVSGEELCIDELLTEAAAFVNELGAFSLREAHSPNARQERALRFLWEIFRALPTQGTANAVGITKAVKLVTLGRVGPALDSQVRKRTGIAEPRSAEEWIAVLRSISVDLAGFERRHAIRLETLVEEHWRPIAVGRAYDMVAGPS